MTTEKTRYSTDILSLQHRRERRGKARGRGDEMGEGEGEFALRSGVKYAKLLTETQHNIMQHVCQHTTNTL